MRPLRIATLAAIVLGLGAAQADARILLPTVGQAHGITVRAADLTVRNTRTQPNGFVAYQVGLCKRSGLHDVMCALTLWQRPPNSGYVPCTWTSRVHYGFKRLSGFVPVRRHFWRLVLPGECFTTQATATLPSGAQVPPA
jgi:hypothetical protein